MDPHEKFVRSRLPHAYLREFSYGTYSKFLIYAAKGGCPALIPSQKTPKDAWRMAARVLGYYAPHQEESTDEKEKS